MTEIEQQADLLFEVRPPIQTASDRQFRPPAQIENHHVCMQQPAHQATNPLTHRPADPPHRCSTAAAAVTPPPPTQQSSYLSPDSYHPSYHADHSHGGGRESPDAPEEAESAAVVQARALLETGAISEEQFRTFAHNDAVYRAEAGSAQA